MAKKKTKQLIIRKQVIGENALYFCVWLGVFLVPFMNAGMMSEQIRPDKMLVAWLKIVPFYLLFIANHYLLFRYLHRKYFYWAYYLVATLLIVGVFSLLEWYEQSDVAFMISLGEVGESVEALHTSLSVFPWWGNMLAAAAMFAANDLIYIFYRTMQKDEDLERLQRQNMQAEMYYLKHQINPHFLMNTLNNIHALVDIDTEAAKQTVIQLSNMMRYVVYDAGGNNISLKDDVKFIKNYIELMRIRYTDDVDIRFDYPRELEERVDVPPLIFIVFVENAFKHGVSYNSASFIHIDIEYKDGYVIGRFVNSISEQSRKSDRGIGLENVRKRLDLIYDTRYSLAIDDAGENYCVTLKIPTLNGDEMYSN
jgi:hypothetical protein